MANPSEAGSCYTQGSRCLSGVAMASSLPALVTTWFSLTPPQTQSLSGGKKHLFWPLLFSLPWRMRPLSPKWLSWKLLLPPRPWFMRQREGRTCARFSSLLPGGQSTISPPMKSIPLALASLAPRTWPSFLSGHSTWLGDFLLHAASCHHSCLPLIWCELSQILSPQCENVCALCRCPRKKCSTPLPKLILFYLVSLALYVINFSTFIPGSRSLKKLPINLPSPWPSGTCLSPNGQL